MQLCSIDSPKVKTAQMTQETQALFANTQLTAFIAFDALRVCLSNYI